jgi:hypothetical protein
VAGVLVGYEPLEGADGDWLVDGSPAAGSLTRGAANPSADGGKRIGSACNQVGPFVISSSDGADIAAGVGVDRTGELALDLTAPILLVWHGSRKPSFPR